ncbi:MAG: nicotinate-nucleotide adenylyltransferase [Gammaproteobacteria bacterium]|nr:nicotinate-nucleotide adenylyltransferase [Gammaproteobacteria bacterium]
MIGIFGGTFDPVHFGHLRTVLEVCEVLSLDEVRFVPCGITPHRAQPLTATEDRLTLLTLALEGADPRFRIDDRELRRSGPSYMVDTLTSIRAEFSDCALCLILGIDAFQGLPAWHRWRDIFKLAHVVVMQRPFEPSYADALERVLAQRLVTERQVLRDQTAGCIYFQDVSQLAISASRIRDLVRQGRSTQYLLPETVRHFIRDKGLYRSPG